MGFWEELTRVEGKIALVTGGGGGLGRGIALDFARAGIDLALCDRDEAALTDVADQCRAMGRKVLARTVDVRDYDALMAFYDEFDAEFPGLDILVNVVGGTFFGPFTDTTPKGWDAIIRINFTQVVAATHAAIPRIRKGGQGGSIINLTSMEAHRGGPRYSIYSAMKTGLVGFAKSLAIELGPEGIRVNNIATGNPQRGRHEPTLDAIDSAVSIPMGRKSTPRDTSGCALFLASELSAYVTGQTLHPDGGSIASSGFFNWPGSGFSHTVPANVLGFLATEAADAAE